MFKFFLKIIFIAILLFGFSNYANYLITGKPPELDFKKPALPDINTSEIKDSISDKFDSVKEKVEPEVKVTYLYKWKDEKGVIHYTSEKPSEKIQNLQSIKLSNQTNVVPSVSEPTNKEESLDISQRQIELPSTTLPENIYSPEGIKRLFDQAKDIQNLVNEQFTEQEDIINQQ